MLGSLALLACGPLYFAGVAAKKRVADLQQLFTLSGLKGLCVVGTGLLPKGGLLLLVFGPGIGLKILRVRRRNVENLHWAWLSCRK